MRSARRLFVHRWGGLSPCSPACCRARPWGAHLRAADEVVRLLPAACCGGGGSTRCLFVFRPGAPNPPPAPACCAGELRPRLGPRVPRRRSACPACLAAGRWPLTPGEHRSRRIHTTTSIPCSRKRRSPASRVAAAVTGEGATGADRISPTSRAAMAALAGAPGESSGAAARENVYEKLSIWRLITSLFAFSSIPELIFGAALLYYFRVFERQIGSNKYTVFIVFSTLVSVLLQILALGYLKDPSINPLMSGPYGLIFASYVPFFFDIPISMKFRILGLSLSDKSFVYLAGLQLLFSSGRRSIVPGVSGILTGLFYRLNTFGIRRVKFPEFATLLFSRLSWPFSSNPYQGLPTTENDGSIPSHQGAHTATQDPTESSIAALVSMGFDRSSAIQALALTDYDVNLASNILLEAQALRQ